MSERTTEVYGLETNVRSCDVCGETTVSEDESDVEEWTHSEAYDIDVCPDCDIRDYS